MPEAIIKYSQLIEDDGGFDKLEQDLEKLGKTIVMKASNFRTQMKFVDVRDTEEIKSLEGKIRELTKAYDTLKKQKETVSNQRKKSADLTKSERIELEKEREAQRKLALEAKAIAKIKSAQTGSIEQLRAKLALVTIAWGNLTDAERDNSQKGERLIASKKNLTDELKKLEKATGDNRRNVGNYAESVKEAIRELRLENKEVSENIAELRKQQSALKKGSAEWNQYEKSIVSAEGRLQQINNELGETKTGGLNIPGGLDIPSGGVSGIGSSIGGLVSSIGPVGVAIGSVLAGVTALGAAVLDIEKKFTSLKNTASGLNLGSQLEPVVENAVALSGTFGDDETELLRAQNVLIKEFGINAETAFKTLESGYLNGANANGELTESILEYSSQIRDAGGDQQDLLNILQKSQQEGIFSDKGIDVVKEFGLRIREQTSATKDALDNAFGKKFTKKIFDGINSGAITSVDALAMISEQMNRTDVNASKLQTVVADVFGGPGEDAGLRYLKSLKDINKASNEYIGLGDPITRGQREQSRLNKELAAAQNNVAKAFEGSGQSITNFGIRAKTVFYDVLAGAGDFISDVSEGVSNLFDFSDPLVQSAGLKQTLDSLVPSLGGLTDSWFELTEAERAAVAENKVYNDVSEIASEILQDELVDINNKVSALYDENLTQEERNELMQELLEKYPQYRKELVDEEGNLRDLESARRDLNRAIVESALARAKEAVFTQAINDLVETQIQKVNAQINLQKEARKERGFFDTGITDALEEVQEANDAFNDQKDILTALRKLDLGSMADEITKLIDGISWDTGQQTFASEIQGLLDQLKPLRKELTSVNKQLEGDLDVKVRSNLERTKKSLDAKIKELEAQLNATQEGQRALLELGNGKDGTGVGGSGGGGGATGSEKLRDKELDLLYEIATRKNELREDELLRDLTAIDLKVKHEIEGFEKLRKEQEKLLSAGIISVDVFNERIRQINEISAIAEEERIKQNLEINEKFNEEQKKKKIKELEDLNKLEISELERQGATKEQIDRKILENVREEIDLRKMLGAVSVEERQKLIDLEVSYLEMSKRIAENQADLVNSLEKAQVEGSIGKVTRLIEDQEKAIADAGVNASKEQFNQLKKLTEDQFDLRKRAIEDEYDYKISKVEKGSLEEQILIQEKNNKLEDLESDRIDKIDSINERSLKKQKDDWKSFADELKQLFSDILDRIEENLQKEVDLNEERVEKQKSAVDEQRARAEQGLSNTLAFEKEEQAKREAELIRSEKRLENIRKAKTFYNDVNARLNALKQGEDPSKAIFGALRDMAFIEAVTASFEDGGVVGKDGYSKVRTNSKGITIGRSHKMKGGIPAFFQGGEGFFSRDEVANLGEDNFYSLKKLAGSRRLSKNIFSEQKVSFEKQIPVLLTDQGVKDEIERLNNTMSNVRSHELDVLGFTGDVLKILEKKYVGGKLREVNTHNIKPRF